MTFKKHYFGFRRFKLWVSFDTFRTPEGYDRAIKNGIRLASMFSWLYLMGNLFNLFIWFPLLIILMIGIGITKFRYFQNKKRKLEFEIWR